METSRGREVLAEMLATGKSAAAAIDALGIVKSTRRTSKRLRAAGVNPKVVDDLKQGRLKAAAP